MFAMPMLMSGGGAPNLAAQVETMLAGTDGYVIPLRSASQLFQDAGGTVAVTAANDPIGRINTLYGTTAHNYQRMVDDTRRGLWTGGAVHADFVNDEMQGDSATLSVFHNKPAFYVCHRAMIDTLATLEKATFGIGFGNNPLCRFDVLTSGALRVQARRTSASTTVTVTSAASLITAGVPFTYEIVMDFAGTGGIEIFLNGTSVATGTLSGTPANSGSTGLTRNYILRSNNNTPRYWDGKFGDMVLTQRLMTAGERATCRAYVEEKFA